MLSSLSNNLRTLVQKAIPGRASSYRVFDVQLQQRIDITPSLVRFVFSGPQVNEMLTLAPDQRVKLLFPGPDGAAPKLACQIDWHKALRQITPAHRPAMRTYTIRALRTEQSEIDIEFVLHGEVGPASRWATHAKPGDCLQMVAPYKNYPGTTGGYEWQPPAGLRHVLLIGDETALPAIAGIIEELAGWPEPPSVQAFIEVPYATDCQPLRHPGSTHIRWLPRDKHQGMLHGQGMLHAARELATMPAFARHNHRGQKLKEIDIETQILWERAAPVNNGFYAWVAGESAAVMAIRRHMVGELGLDKRALTFMGYWRLGRVLD